MNRFNDIKNVSILGTGMMGPGIAVLFAKAGYKTSIWGPNRKEVERGRNNFRHNLKDLEDEGLIELEKVDEIMKRITVTDDLMVACKEADFVVEAIIENLQAKQDIFTKLEEICSSDTIIGSNTSTLLPSLLNKKMKNKKRMIVTHFWNPAYLVPLVEVCGSQETDKEVIQTTMRLMEHIGKMPVLMNKEVLGFIGNRIMHAMYREAISLVEKGIATPEDIDKVVLTSFGPRFANLGPLEYLDFNGLDLIKSVQSYLFGDLDNTKGVMKIIEDKVEKGELGIKSGKGFFDWRERNPDEVRERRDKEFIRRMKEENK